MYTDIANGDTLFSKHIWRFIDLREQTNAPLSYDTSLPRDRNFIAILFTGLQRGEYSAYRSDTCDTNQLLSMGDIPMFDTLSGTLYKQLNIVGLKIMEEWLFLKSSGKMEGRIIAFAPVAASTMPNNTSENREMFWVLYADIKNQLAQHYCLKTPKPLSFLEYFDQRKFSSRVVKVSRRL